MFVLRRLLRRATLFSAGVICLVGTASALPVDTQSPEGCDCLGRVGNVNCDYRDEVDVTDLTLLISHLFVDFTPLPNRQEANIDGDPNGVVDVTDLTTLIDYLFISFGELPECSKPPNAPPVTTLRYVDRDTAVNASGPGFPATGVAAAWRGSDKIDFPYQDVPFTFEWRVYGPYYVDAQGGSAWDSIRTKFVKEVFRRNNGEIIPLGEGRFYTVCDTMPVPVGTDSVTLIVTCDTVWVDTIQYSTDEGRRDTLLDVNAPAFLANPAYNKIALSSTETGKTWVSDSSSIFYNLFAHDPSDTTAIANFIIWVRARDPVDSTIVDPTPAFAPITVIEPKFERDMGVVQAASVFCLNCVRTEFIKDYWRTAIQNWRPESNYVDSCDFLDVRTPWGYILPLTFLLSHKVVIVQSDNAATGALNLIAGNLAEAVGSGVNVWVMSRAPFIGGEVTEPNFDPAPYISPVFQSFFGVSSVVFSGWDWWVRMAPLVGGTSRRIEDFIGATSENPSLWPHLPIDTANLHARYAWDFSHPWIDTIAALPEVDYLIPAANTEVMYRYASRYGTSHFLGEQYSFEGKPVAVRVQTPVFRTVFWMFTPYAFDDSLMQPVINSVLDWLHDSTSSSLPSNPGYKALNRVEADNSLSMDRGE